MLTANEAALLLAIIGMQTETEVLYPQDADQALSYIEGNNDTSKWASEKREPKRDEYRQLTLAQMGA